MVSRFACYLLLPVLATLISSDRPPRSLPRIESTDQAVRLLGDPHFAVREQATRWLWQQGERVRDALESATRNRDREIARRARLLLDRLALGIRPETPADVVRAIRRYLQGSSSEKTSILKTLLAKGHPDAAVRLLQFSLDRNEPWIQSQVEIVLPYLVFSGQSDLTEKLLEKNAQRNAEAASMYRSFLVSTGRLPKAIAKWEARCRQDPSPAHWQELAMLYRAHGDMDQAIDTARKIAESHPDLLELLLCETDRFDELADRLARKLPLNDEPPAADQWPRYGYLLVFEDQAGKQREAAELLKTLRRWTGKDTTRRRLFSRILLASGRFDEALPIIRKDAPLDYFELTKSLDRWDAAFQWLGIRDFDDPALQEWLARKITEASKQGNSASAAAALLTVCRTLGRAGRSDLAAAPLDQLFQDSSKRSARLFVSEAGKIIERELEMGLRDQALQHAAVVFTRSSAKEVLPIVFGEESELARFWWSVFLGPETQDPFGEATVPFRRTLEKLANLLERRMSADELRTWVLDTARKMFKEKPARLADALPLLVETLRHYGLYDDAVKLLDDYDASGDHNFLRADLLAQRKEYREAAELYHQQSTENAESALLRFLESLCWEKAGDSDRAAQALLTANQLALDPLDRIEIASELVNRHWDEAAVDQLRHVLRVAGPTGRDEALYSWTQRQLTLSDYADVATNNDLRRAWRWTLWQAIDPEEFGMRGSYFPYFVFQTRFHEAKYLLEQGRVEKALQVAEQARAAAPTSIEIAEFFVPKLVELGRRKDADRLFASIDKVMSNMCQMFPKAALYPNNLAWMYAKCGRKLDEALKLAERAVELEPDNATYLDTLAEVEFLRGNRDRAVELARRCIRLDPDHRHYRRQLQRFLEADVVPSGR